MKDYFSSLVTEADIVDEKHARYYFKNLLTEKLREEFSFVMFPSPQFEYHICAISNMPEMKKVRVIMLFFGVE